MSRTPIGGLVPPSRWSPLVAAAALAVAVGLPASHARAQEEPAAQRLEVTTESEEARHEFQAGLHDMANVYGAAAAAHFARALEADPDFGLAKVLHAFTAPGLGGEAQAARIDEGIAALASASTNELLVGLAFKEWGAGNAPAASRMFQAASELLPDDPYLATWATQLAAARGDQTDVVARWEAVADRFPEAAHPHNLIAYQEYQRGNEAAAMAAVERYVELAPDHPNAADSHAELLQWAGRYPEALAEYQRAVQLDPDYFAGYTGAAEVMMLLGSEDGAREYLERALEHAATPGTRVTTLRALAHTYMIAGDGDAALERLEEASGVAEAADLTGARAFVHEEMALAEGLLGSGDAVRERLAEAALIRDSEENPVHLALASLAHAAAGQAAAAREAAGTLSGMSDNLFLLSLSRAAEAMVMLQEDDADAALDLLVEADPSNPVVQAVMAEAYDRLDRPDAAAGLRQRVTGNRQIDLTNPLWAYAMTRISQT